jgi:uncharacterized membrane protein YjjP (DUF1212 family)
MEYSKLLDMATDLGYELAMSGAETFRVEESINLVLAAYGVEAEVFAIPNYLIVSITTDDGTPMTRMRRIGAHGNDLDAVEKFSGLSRAYCNRKPQPDEGSQWLDSVRKMKVRYTAFLRYLGAYIGAAGFCILFGGSYQDAVFSGICGLVVQFFTELLSKVKSNPFFNTIGASFAMSLVAYVLNIVGLVENSDAVTIGALMLLVPGLLFTNAMRDIIYGDTNSGINRIIQVLLTAIAIALGTAVGWQFVARIWGEPLSAADLDHSMLVHGIASFVGCIGFSILFNIHGPGVFLCALGGMLSWLVYLVSVKLGAGNILAYFWSALFASVYSESMARIRKCPAISYLLVAIFTMIPGAGAYYTMNYAVRGEMELFAQTGMQTAAIAGILAVGILLGSTLFRLHQKRK